MLKSKFEDSIRISDFIKILQGLADSGQDLRCLVKATAPYSNTAEIVPATGIMLQKIAFIDTEEDNLPASEEMAIIFETRQV